MNDTDVETTPMNVEEQTAARLGAVRDAIAAAAGRSGRRPEDVLLVAVTKFAAPEQVRAMLHLGHRDFGENRLQHLLQHAAMVDEYLERHRVLAHSHRPNPVFEEDARGDGTVPDRVRWHMIGHLQRNKARKAAQTCRLIQSVDSLRVAEELQAAGHREDRPVEVLVQVNISGEATKSGLPGPAARHVCEQIDTMIHVRVRGLMTIAPLIEDEQEKRRAARETFARCRELFEDIRRTGVGEGRFNILSMGMTDDYDIAIEEGANLVRVGSAIFGVGEPKPEDD